MCQCEPVVTTIVLFLIGTGRVGAGVGIRFTPELISKIIEKVNARAAKRQLRRIDSNFAEVQAIESTRVNRREYIVPIERRLKCDPIYIQPVFNETPAEPPVNNSLFNNKII